MARIGTGGPWYSLLVVCSKNVCFLHHFWHVTTFTVYVSAYSLQKSLEFLRLDMPSDALLFCCAPCSNRSIKLAAGSGTERRTDRRTPYCFADSAVPTMPAGSANNAHIERELCGSVLLAVLWSTAHSLTFLTNATLTTCRLDVRNISRIPRRLQSLGHIGWTELNL